MTITSINAVFGILFALAAILIQTIAYTAATPKNVQGYFIAWIMCAVAAVSFMFTI